MPPQLNQLKYLSFICQVHNCTLYIGINERAKTTAKIVSNQVDLMKKPSTLNIHSLSTFLKLKL